MNNSEPDTTISGDDTINDIRSRMNGKSVHESSAFNPWWPRLGYIAIGVLLLMPSALQLLLHRPPSSDEIQPKDVHKAFSDWVEIQKTAVKPADVYGELKDFREEMHARTRDRIYRKEIREWSQKLQDVNPGLTIPTFPEAAEAGADESSE